MSFRMHTKSPTQISVIFEYKVVYPSFSRTKPHTASNGHASFFQNCPPPWKKYVLQHAVSQCCSSQCSMCFFSEVRTSRPQNKGEFKSSPSTSSSPRPSSCSAVIGDSSLRPSREPAKPRACLRRSSVQLRVKSSWLSLGALLRSSPQNASLANSVSHRARRLATASAV